MFYFRTQGFNGYAIKYSPFFDNRIAVASAANFGLVGNGRLYILGLTPEGVVGEKWFDTQDGLFDLAWSEMHENQVVAASGDGSVKLFDIALNDFPIQNWHEHKREVFGVHWNLIEKKTFCTSSWDGTVKIWTPTHRTSLQTLPTGSCTYSTSFSPHNTHLVSCVSSDSILRIFDLRVPQPALPLTDSLTPPALARPAIRIPVPGGSELLTHDWNKYRLDMIATGGVDKVIRVFDLRAPLALQGTGNPNAMEGTEDATGKVVNELRGHEYAIRKLVWSPHWPGVLMSAGYDMTVRVWSDGIGEASGGGLPITPPSGGLLGIMDKHTEFVAGLDWCLFGGEGWAASAGWDEAIWVWDAKGIMVGRR